jgi:Ca2+-binding EF-hand superfamily protein
MSVTYGGASGETFKAMLAAARSENPQATILVKTHPEVTAAKSLTKVALNFGSMLRSFEAIRVVFERVDADKNGAIEYDEFLTACGELRIQMSEEENQVLLRDVYSVADVNKDGRVDFREFVMALTIVFLVAAAERAEKSFAATTKTPSEPKETEAEMLTHDALDKVLAAWLLFDESGEGFIHKSEVQKGLASYADGAHADHAAGATSKLISARFSEMNWDKTDTISFQEFLYAVEGWCGLEEEEE